jgi:tetratricopeptide (TPR) repeat protein
VEQGQASAALELFLPLAHQPLPTPDDERALALLLAPLLARAGRAQEGLALLERSTWPQEAPAATFAHEARGELLAELGDIDRSLAEFRHSLERLAHQQIARATNLHINIGRRALTYLGDREQAQREATQAQLNLELLQGEIANAAGDFQAARTHYNTALTLAEHHGSDHRLAKIHEELGVLEARYAKMELAVEHLEAAGRHYAAAGNQICAVGMTNSGLAYAYLLNRRYREVIAPAQTALAYFKSINHAFWSAINEAYLAEAWFYLDDCQQAEQYAQSGLRREEPVVQPYCLYIMGQIRRVQEQLADARRFCREALRAGEEINDPWALAPAWLALAETERDAGCLADAQDAFVRAIAIYEQLGVAQEISYAKALQERMILREGMVA